MGRSRLVATLTIYIFNISCHEVTPEMERYCLTTLVPNTHQTSYKKRPARRMPPVLKESILSKDIAWCANDKARMFVRSMDFVCPLEKIYRMDGIVASGMRAREDVVHEICTMANM